MTMLIPTLLLSFLCLSLSSPGVPWTEEESLIVKAKIYAIMGSGAKAEEYLEIHKERKAELHEYVIACNCETGGNVLSSTVEIEIPHTEI